VKEEIKNLIDQIILEQEKKVLKCGQTFVPRLTSEDVLQPIDYPELEHNPHFRYEEGTLAGMHTIRSALLAFFQEQLK
jgi:hypothetical protein